MANKFFHHNISLTPSANPQSLWQIRVPANGRTILHAIELMPLGSTPAAAPLEFGVVLQSADGTYTTDDSANIIKEVPAFGASILSTVFITCTVEPGTNTLYYPVTCHQQAVRRWTPPTKSGVLVLDTGTRWALRNIGALFSIPIRASFVLEE